MERIVLLCAAIRTSAWLKREDMRSQLLLLYRRARFDTKLVIRTFDPVESIFSTDFVFPLVRV